MTHEFWSEWRAAIEPELSAITAPDRETDGAGSVKIVFDTELDVPCHAGYFGMAGELFGVGFRHVNGAGFRDQGPTFLMNVRAIEAAERLHDIRIMQANGVAIHELAHCYDFHSLRGITFRRGDESVKALVLNGLKTLPAADPEYHAEAGIDHGKFIRRSIHLSWRLIQRGFVVPVEMLHGWSPAEAWSALTALGDELERLESLPIREVDQTPMPAPFRELFAQRQEVAA